MDDDELDYTGIPDNAPPAINSQWALGPPQLITSIEQLRETLVPVLTKEKLVGQLYLEMMDRSTKNQTARIMAAKLIAELQGWIKSPDSGDDKNEEDTSGITAEEVKFYKDEFERSY